MKKFTNTNSLFSFYEKVYKDDFAIKFNKYPNFAKSLIDIESINIFMVNYNYDVSDELRFISNKYDEGFLFFIDADKRFNKPSNHIIIHFYNQNDKNMNVYKYIGFIPNMKSEDSEFLKFILNYSILE